MLGAVIGDIAGSRFEFHNIKTEDFTLFTDKCFFTDDTVMSAAVAQALLDCSGNYDDLAAAAVKNMQAIGQNYPDCGYGGRFGSWIFQDDPQPYNSWGNGSAMRISPVGFAAHSIEQAKELSYKVTAVSHNHPEGILGAEAVAVAIVLARGRMPKKQIKKYISEHYYKLDFTLEEIRPDYSFSEFCRDSVPQALEAFFEARDFESAIKKAISIGGDSDTIAAMTGGIAEAYYGIPQTLKKAAYSYLDPRLTKIVREFESRF